VTNTFGVPGVEENCFFLKTIAEAKKLRQRINESFEIASLPNTTYEERKRLLTFVIVLPLPFPVLSLSPPPGPRPVPFPPLLLSIGAKVPEGHHRILWDPLLAFLTLPTKDEKGCLPSSSLYLSLLPPPPTPIPAEHRGKSRGGGGASMSPSI